jgi:RNAse (barnase) inhibitor barstar
MESGVYRAARAEPISQAAQRMQLSLARIAFGEKETLMRNFAAALRFPAWFGHNWDALEDCLGDLSWSDAPGHVLLIEGARAGDEFGILLDVLRSSAESWAARGKPFLAVFVDPDGALPLPRLEK